MAKLTLTDLTQLASNETSAVSAINANSALIEAAMENTLSLDGTTPNSMAADLDLNGNDLLNIGSFSISGGDTLADIVGYAEEWANKAEDSLVSVAAGGDGSTEYSALHWSAKAAADVVLTNADVVLTNADVVLTNADVVLTNADVVLTNADVVSAGVSETNAAASAAAAAASAAGIFWKEPVLNATTANITLSGEQTLDGVLTSTSRILVKDQTASEENGVYVTAAGAWARATPLDTWDEHVGAAVIVSEGTAHGDSAWICTVDAGGTLDTTAITWAGLSQVYTTATTTSEGIIETSTDAEMLTGTATDKAVTPSNATYLRTQDTSYTGDQTFGPITETQTVKATSFTPSLTAEGTIYNCNAAITITMPTATAGKGFTIIHDDGTEITWSGTILWAGGAAPTAAAAKEIYVFISDGTNWYGNLVGTGYA
jgi:hypothetical protein